MSARTLLALALLTGAATPATAIDLGALKGAAGKTDGSSLLSANAGNAAGIIEFCIKNNYLDKNAAAKVKDKLLGQLSLGQSQTAPNEDDSGYANGLKGLLSASDGKTLDLAGGKDKLKDKLTRKACDAVLEQARGMLGR